MTAHACHAHQFGASDNMWQFYANLTQTTTKHNNIPLASKPLKHVGFNYKPRVFPPLVLKPRVLTQNLGFP